MSVENEFSSSAVTSQSKDKLKSPSLIVGSGDGEAELFTGFGVAGSGEAACVTVWQANADRTRNVMASRLIDWRFGLMDDLLWL